METHPSWRFGPFVIDLRERVLERNGQAVALTPKAFDLLAVLVEKPGQLVAKDELLRRVWPDTFVEEANVAYNVFALRKALGDTADEAGYIETVPKRGYRFVAAVAPVEGASRHAARHAPGTVTGPATATPGPLGSNVTFARWLRWLAGAAVAVAAIGLVILVRWWPASPTPEPAHAVPITSLPGVVRSPSLSPDGRYVAFSWIAPGQDDFDVYVQQIGAGTPLRRTTDPAGDQAPSWSPDGRAIAFLRVGPDGRRIELWLVPPLGGVERKLAELAPRLPYVPPQVSLAWCPDSSCVLTTDSPGPAQGDALFAVAVESGAKRQLTNPEGEGADLAPAVSPDGQTLVFRRYTTPFSGALHRLGFGSRTAPARPPARLTSTIGLGTVAWTRDSRQIVLSMRGALWRLDPFAGGTPTRLPFVGQDGQSPAIAAIGDGQQRLVYVRSVSDINVWNLAIASPGAPASAPPAKAITSTRVDFTPGLSPDGRRVSFVSDRSGEAQVWVADGDGAAAVQLTSLALGGFPGFPRWSPDGRLIAFHGDPRGRPDVIVVPAAGGATRVPTAHLANGGFPSFSRDGRWLYFTLREGTETRIWKMPASGSGPPVRITSAAASVAVESASGDALYYASSADRPTTLWRLPLADGAPSGSPIKVLDGVLGANFDVVEGGIYYLERLPGPSNGPASSPAGRTRLQYYAFATGRATTIADDLGIVGFGLSASRDGRRVYYGRVDSTIDELMVVDDFR